MFKALNGLLCADVPLRNYSLTHSHVALSHSGVWDTAAPNPLVGWEGPLNLGSFGASLFTPPRPQ